MSAPIEKLGEESESTPRSSLEEPSPPPSDPEKAPAPPAGPNPDDFPDGGIEAWLVVLGAFCTIFASFGWINCIGIFQDYYLKNQLSSYSSSTVAWIPSTESFFMFACGPMVGKITDNWGPRIPLAIGTFLHIFGLMMVSISDKYYQIFLSQSVVSAIGCSFLFYPSATATATWFLRHRALAIGIAVAGSSIGGIVLPIMVNRLVNDIGFGWTMRAVAFLLLGIVLIGNFTIKSRIPPTKRPLRFMDFIEPYTEPTFFFLTLGVWFVYLGGFLPFTFIIVQARAQGMSTTLAGYLVSILNASSTFGRIIPAHFGDVYGVFNVMVIFTAFGAIANLALWLPSTTISGNTNALIIVFVVLYGFASGCFFSILMAMVAQISDIRKIGVRTGSMYIIASIGVLIGSPIAGAIEGAGSNGFLGLTIFSGLVLMIGAMLVGYSRVLQVGWGLKAKA